MIWKDMLINWAFPTVSTFALMSLIFLAVRRSQRLNPSLTQVEGKRALMMLPNRAVLAIMFFGIVMFGSCCASSCWLLVVSLESDSDAATWLIIFWLLICIIFLSLTALFAFYTCHYWKSRVFVFDDGLLFRMFLREPRFMRWSGIKRVECRPVRKDLAFISVDGAKSCLDTEWNGVAYLFFCLDSFLEELQWSEARQALEEELRKKGDLGEIRREFDEMVLTHPLDTAQPEDEPRPRN